MPGGFRRYMLATMLIDTHNHLDFPDFDADRDEVLARCRALGVRRQVLLGVFRDNWQRVWDLANAEDGFYTALGLHPVYLAQHRDQHLLELREWLERHAGQWQAQLLAVPYRHDLSADQSAALGRPDWAHALRHGRMP